MIHYAMKYKKPLLGICRGQQIINAVNGGTLIPDIPTINPDSPIKHRNESDRAHIIMPIPGSWITSKFPVRAFWVNSRHHQCVDELANGFEVAAYAPDGIVESIELVDKHRHPFVIGVQWHPENLRDSLSTYLGQLFLEKTD
jgi:putative glutamine amidotransferase